MTPNQVNIYHVDIIFIQDNFQGSQFCHFAFLVNKDLLYKEFIFFQEETCCTGNQTGSHKSCVRFKQKWQKTIPKVSSPRLLFVFFFFFFVFFFRNFKFYKWISLLVYRIRSSFHTVRLGFFKITGKTFW